MGFSIDERIRKRKKEFIAYFLFYLSSLYVLVDYYFGGCFLTVSYFDVIHDVFLFGILLFIFMFVRILLYFDYGNLEDVLNIFLFCFVFYSLGLVVGDIQQRKIDGYFVGDPTSLIGELLDWFLNKSESFLTKRLVL